MLKQLAVVTFTWKTIIIYSKGLYLRKMLTSAPETLVKDLK